MSWQAGLEEALDELEIPCFISNINGRKVVRVEMGSKAIEIERWGSKIFFSVMEWDETGGLTDEISHTEVSLTDETPVTASRLAEIALSIYSEYE
ncbi:hypothetical protein SEA_BILLNYE_204 [Streptomyces phage BillNye]|uniref:Uncharacterized protein n=1 Tax=Streptomyces phage BillNye TaxID=2079426 RepID=A0A2L1IW28_9CAUD|nr:hypothetical protein FDJ30_gp057 [Streptomyces phage BillNye]AVD99376.1 hypothetical protein SEA_BILLNYE_204 [Streptomyces phage BillNye]